MPVRAASLYDGTNTITFPLWFSYIPPVPKKRWTSTATNQAVITQAAGASDTVWADARIDWVCKVVCQSTYKSDFYDHYVGNTSPVTWSFRGFQDDVYLVLWEGLKVDRQKGGLLDLSGHFRVLDLVSAPSGDDDLLSAFTNSHSESVGGLPYTI